MNKLETEMLGYIIGLDVILFVAGALKGGESGYFFMGASCAYLLVILIQSLR